MASVLVVEDEIMIALSLETTLEEIGFASVHVATSLNQALEVLNAERIDCALVDYKLADGTAEPVIRDMEVRGIPFIVVTGYDDRALGDLAKAGWPILSKPLNLTMLRAALVDMGLP